MSRKCFIISFCLAVVLFSTIPAIARSAYQPFSVTPCTGNCPCYTGSITVHPANPTSNDEIQVVTSGLWSSSCPVVAYTHWICDYNIYFYLSVVDRAQIQPGVCLTIITTWTVTQTLGILSPGTYTVQANIYNIGIESCWSTWERITFTVSPATTPQSKYLQYLPWVACSQ